LRKEAPQVVNTQWAGLPFLQAAAECGIPVIATIQNTYVWLDAAAWEAEKQRSRHFSHATATSELAKDYYLKWNNAYNREWITVIPNGIDPQRVILTDYSQARLQLGLPDSAFVFLSLASYDGRKNQLGLFSAFDAAARLDPDLQLICAGNVADEKYYQEVRAYHRSLSSRERLHLYEFRQDTSLLLSAADGFVVDSFFEGWSLAASEALMAGLPLIHSECGSAAELVGANGERGCQVPNPACPSLDLTWELVQAAMDQKQQANTPALIQALLQMAAEREKWHSQRHELRAFALEHFGIDHILRQYKETIESVIYR